MFSIRDRRRKSIRFRLMLDIGTILVVACVFNYLLVRLIYQGILERENSKKSELIANIAVKQAQSINENSHGLLSNVIQTLDMENELPVIKEKLKQIQVFTSKFKELIVLDVNGIGTGLYQDYYDLRDTTIIKKVEQNESISFNVLVQDDVPYIVFGQSITNSFGETVGILLGIRELEVFFDQITAVSGGEIYFVGNSLGDGFMSVGPKGTEERIKILSKNLGIQKLFEKQPIEGKDYTIQTQKGAYNVQVNYGKIEGTELMLGVVSCANEITGILNDFKKAMLIGMIIVISGGLMIMYMVTSSVVSRLSNMSKHIECNIENEVIEPLPEELLKNEDEIGELARGMNQLESQLEDMLTSVKESMDYMNNKVSLLNAMNDNDMDKDMD